MIASRRCAHAVLLAYIYLRVRQWTSAGTFLVERLIWQDVWSAMWDWLVIGWLFGVVTTGMVAAYAEWSYLTSWPRRPPPPAKRSREEHDRHRFWRRTTT